MMPIILKGIFAMQINSKQIFHGKMSQDEKKHTQVNENIILVFFLQLTVALFLIYHDGGKLKSVLIEIATSQIQVVKISECFFSLIIYVKAIADGI